MTSYPKDVHGMMPRTHLFMTNAKEGKIVVVVPLHHLRGMSDKCSSNLRLEIRYTITDTKYINNIDTPEMRVVSRDYDTWIDNPLIGCFVPDEEVIENITLALNYIKFVKKFLEKNKERPDLGAHPCSFEIWNAYIPKAQAA